MISGSTEASGTTYATSHPVPRLRTASGRCGVGPEGAEWMAVGARGAEWMAVGARGADWVATGTRRAKWVALLLVGLMTGGCLSSQPTRNAAPGGAITVAAAASLTEAFTQIGKDFQAKNPGSTVTFTFGSSATLAAQITQGAPVDVFAAASPATMKTVTGAGAADPPTNFVSNTLEIAVPKGNPHHIAGLKDFADKSRRIALCDPSVPCGAAAVTVFKAAKIAAAPDTLEQDVKAALQKVSRDEVDAALVYRTDVISSPDQVDGIEFPEAKLAVNRYLIAALRASKNATLAKAFVDYVLSPAGQVVLTKAGFAKP
jgi:molybdate transport system substrate-binding protein